MNAPFSATRTSAPWHARLSDLVARHKFSHALRLLDRVIEDELPLLRDLPEIREQRRLAWLCRIHLLLERGRLSEALAWVCLECELSTENIAALALKDRLIRQLHLRTESNDEHESKALTVDWHGVAGMRELKALLERDVLLPLLEPELYRRYKLDMPNGILFYGPPGCGKTFIARALASRLSYGFQEVKPSDLASPYIHDTQKKIGALFKKAREAAPTLLFFDELDALVPDRSAWDVHQYQAAEVNEFLMQLNECAKQNVLVVAATNLPTKIDPAILRPGRLDKKIYIASPDMEARVEALRLFTSDRPQVHIDWIGLGRRTDNYSFAELEHLANEAARAALHARRRISFDDFITAIKANPPMSKDQYQPLD